MSSYEDYFDTLEDLDFDYGRDTLFIESQHGNEASAGSDYTSSSSTLNETSPRTPRDFNLDFEFITTSCACLDKTFCFGEARDPFFPGPLELAQPSISLSPLQRNEAVSSPPVQEMETAGVLLPQNPHALPVESSRMTEQSPPYANNADLTKSLGNLFTQEPTMNPSQSLYDTPERSGYVDHFQASNMRESVEHEVDGLGDKQDTEAARILANGTKANDKLEQTTEILRAMPEDLKREDAEWKGFNGYDDPEEAILDPEPPKETAYAMLKFMDCDYYVKNYDVIVGRNQQAFLDFKRRRREQKRAQELEMYRQEPSQPSQPGDGEQQVFPSNSSQSMEGRPALPSNFSEHGGAVSYHQDSDNEDSYQHSRRRKHGNMYLSKSSSTTSIAPASLEASSGYKPTYEFENNEPVDRLAKAARIEVHTADIEDIQKISREHLKYSYNFTEQRWELHVLGNRALVNDEVVNRGECVPLQHDDEIIVVSVRMIFKLPLVCRESPGVSHGTTFHSDSELDELSDDDQSNIGTSPVRRLSTAMDTIEGDEEDDEDVVEPIVGKKRGRPPNNKLEDTRAKPKKQPPKVKAEKSEKTTSKGKKKEQESIVESTELPKKAEKAEKPKAAAKDAPAASEEPKASSSQPAPQIEPGSGLEGIPLDQLPQRRKGPGRPPKNGLLSKRDNALVARKKKDLEKEGKPIPDFNELVAQVRYETKMKELQSKAAANGQTLPDIPMQSIEPPVPAEGSGMLAVNMAGAPETSAGQPVIARRPPSPKPKRERERSLSPIKPESELTEEELRKPTGTYVHILDEILQNHPEGQAGLQTIYHLIMKRYPYFKYKTGGIGWQSSVRHNLLQTKRFKESGKEGKGRLWSIDHDVPLEKEKNKVRHRSPPPMGQPMPNGLPGPSYNGQQQYGNPYAQAPSTGQPQFNAGPHPSHGAYASPYGQPNHQNNVPGQGQPGPSHYQQSRSVNQGTHHPNAQSQRQGAQASPAAPPQQDLLPIVSAIIAFQTEWVTPFRGPPDNPQPPAWEAQKQLFNECLNDVSDIWPKTRGLGNILEKRTSENEKSICLGLDKLFAKYYVAPGSEGQQTDPSVQRNIADVPQGGSGGRSTAAAQADPAPPAQATASASETAFSAPAQPAPASAEQPTERHTALASESANAAPAPAVQPAERSAAPAEVPEQQFLPQSEQQTSSGTKRGADTGDAPDAKRVREGT